MTNIYVPFWLFLADLCGTTSVLHVMIIIIIIIINSCSVMGDGSS